MLYKPSEPLQALIWHDLSPLKYHIFKIQAQENNKVCLFEEMTNVSGPFETKPPLIFLSFSLVWFLSIINTSNLFCKKNYEKNIANTFLVLVQFQIGVKEDAFMWKVSLIIIETTIIPGRKYFGQDMCSTWFIKNAEKIVPQKYEKVCTYWFLIVK